MSELSWRVEPRSAERQRLRDALFEQSFAEEGLDLALLLERARVERASFDCEFADLQDFFCTILEGETAELLERVASVFASQDEWADRLRAAAYALLDFLEADRRRARFMVVDAYLGGERAILIRDQGMWALFAFIDLGRQELEDPDSLTAATAEAIGSSIYAQIRSELEKGESGSLTALVPEMMYVAVLPYLGAAAAEEELEMRAPVPSGRAGGAL